MGYCWKSSIMVKEGKERRFSVSEEYMRQLGPGDGGRGWVDEPKVVTPRWTPAKWCCFLRPGGGGFTTVTHQFSIRWKV